MVICADGLTGIKEAINAAFPKTESSAKCFPKRSFFAYSSVSGNFRSNKKNGPYLSETGAESTVKCALCTKVVCQTNPLKKTRTCFLRTSCL